MNELISTFTDPETWIIVLFVIITITLAATVDYQIKLSKSEKWNKTQSSLYAKAIIEIARIRDLVNTKIMERSATLIYMSELSADLRIAERSTKRKSLRKEIARLKQLNQGLATKLKIEVERNKNIMLSKYKLIEEVNEDKERIQHLTETIEKRKHQPIQKDVELETGWWKSISDQYLEFFPKEGVFKEDRCRVQNDDFINLINYNGKGFMVEKKHFRPIKIM